ncbi:MAG: PaaI family thioesterase [Vibrio sp.]
MDPLQQANAYLAEFAQKQVPLIGYCEPEILVIDDEKVEIKIPLQAKTKNHLNSMYFGALAVGADTAGGYLAMHKAGLRGHQISLAFKSVQGEFLKRPEADVVFVCRDGQKIDAMLDETIASGERVNQSVQIDALCPSLHQDEVMATFQLTLSVKALTS